MFFLFPLPSHKAFYCSFLVVDLFAFTFIIRLWSFGAPVLCKGLLLTPPTRAFFSFLVIHKRVMIYSTGDILD